MSIATKITSLTNARNAIRTALTNKGVSGVSSHGFSSFANDIASIATGGLPSGFSAIAKGTWTLSTGGAGSFTVPHTLGVIPDVFLIWLDGNVAATYTELFSMRFPDASSWRGTNYLNICAFHGTSSTSVSCSLSSKSYAITALTASNITLKQHASSYQWPAGSYKWLAIKF